MIARPFTQVDVFTARAYFGNPVAVVHDGSGLDAEQMLHFARWTHLSETTFLLPPTPEGSAAGADYRLRIFTPTRELPFAGHPTLGSCHAWLHMGAQPRAATHVVQECAQGLVRIRRDGARLAFAAPPSQRSPIEPTRLPAVLQALGLRREQVLEARLLDNGPVFLALLLDSAEAVLHCQPDWHALQNLGQEVGLCHVDTGSSASNLIVRSNREARAFSTPAAAEASVTVRVFAALAGFAEDPVTGSFNASLAQWLIAEGLAPARYTAYQGACLGRDGTVHIAQDDRGQVWVGGDCVACVHGTVTL